MKWKTTNQHSESCSDWILQVPSCSCELILSHSTCYLTNKGGSVFLSVRKMPPKKGWLGERAGERRRTTLFICFSNNRSTVPASLLLNELRDLPFPAAATQLQCTAQYFCCSNSLGGVWNANISSHIYKGDSRRKRIKAFRSEMAYPLDLQL